MSNRQLEENAEQLRNELLAEELGIPIEELEQLEWTEETVESDKGMPYHTLIEFSAGSPKEILDKISGLENGRSIRLSLNTFDEPE